MDWIKNNPFVAALSGGTLIICIVLFIVASNAGSKFDEAKEGFDTAYSQVSKSERIPLYPEASNRDAKKKALDDYRESIVELRSLFDDYRVDEIERISTQEFTARLKAANEEVKTAFNAVDCELPEDFFMGFERYRNLLAESEATGVLNYQVNALKHALLDLADAIPSELISIYREPIPEESGQKFEVGENQVARKFGYEVAFRGSEQSARKFISALGDVDPYYYVVRTISIKNEKDIPPRVSDAEFKITAAERNIEAAPSFEQDFFSDFATEETDDTQEEAVVEDTVEEVVEEPEPAVDSTRILAQVLGGEELIVFVRFDLTLFLPTEELPKP